MPSVLTRNVVVPACLYPGGIDFAQLMKNTEARKSMVAFAKSEFSEENLLFFEAVKVYRRTYQRRGAAHLSDAENQTMRVEAGEIVNKFLVPSAPFALNLPAHLLEDFLNGLPEEVTAQTFDKCVRVIFKAIEQDTFQRFQGTELAHAASELLSTKHNRRRSSSDSVLSQESLVSMAAKDATAA